MSKEKPIKFTLRFSTKKDKENHKTLLQETQPEKQNKSLTSLILSILNKESNAIRKNSKRD